MTRIRIFYPADPIGVVPGGIDTFIRGILKWAPDDLGFSLVGVTTDPMARVPGRWSRCSTGRGCFDFFPVTTLTQPGRRGRLPLSLRFTAAAWRHRAALRDGFDVFEFHRVEPSLLYLSDPRPKNAYFHQDPESLRLPASDNLWRRMPALYEGIEKLTMRSMSTVWCVHEIGVGVLRTRYPAQAARIRFVPTWVDADEFMPPGIEERASLRNTVAGRLGISTDDQWIVSVGRLDTQKNPAMMLGAFARLRAAGRRLRLLVVGDGVLRESLQLLAERAGVADRVHFLGLCKTAVIADLLKAADLFALSSAYEGMPMALLEALGCGLPAVVTEVGEVRRVVHDGINGAIADGHSEESFAQALDFGLDHATDWRGRPALDAVAAFRPAEVLAPVYENYRALVARRPSGVPDAVVETVAEEDGPPEPA